MNISIDEVIYVYRMGSKEAEELLFSWVENNIGLIWEDFQKNAPPYNNDYDDALSLAYCALKKIIAYYDEEKSSFHYFWKMAMKQECYRLNTHDEVYVDFCLLNEDYLADSYDADAEYEVKDLIERVVVSPYQKCGDKASEVIQLLIEGYTLGEIVKLTDLTLYKVRSIIEIFDEENNKN